MEGELEVKGEEGEIKKEEEVKKEEEQTVTLTGEQYNALVDRLAELEDSLLHGPAKKEVYTLDELESQGRRRAPKTEAIAEEDIDGLTNTQLANLIFDKAKNEVILPLQTEVATLKVLREIDKCELKHNDFWEYEKEIYAISTKNPSLSIEDSYKLAKGDRKEKEEANPEKRIGKKVHNLPPKVILGEKPGSLNAVTKTSEVKTLKDAATRAWEEIEGAGKK